MGRTSKRVFTHLFMFEPEGIREEVLRFPKCINAQKERQKYGLEWLMGLEWDGGIW